MNSLYIGDVNEHELAGWLSENISPIVMTTRAEWQYFDMFHGDNDLWIMDTTDVSDLSSSRYDTITHVQFKNKEDCMLCHLAWGGSIQ